MAQQDRLRRARCVVLFGKITADRRPDPEQRKGSRRHPDASDFLRLRDSGDGQEGTAPHPQVDKGLVMVAVGEVKRG